MGMEASASFADSASAAAISPAYERVEIVTTPFQSRLCPDWKFRAHRADGIGPEGFGSTEADARADLRKVELEHAEARGRQAAQREFLAQHDRLVAEGKVIALSEKPIPGMFGVCAVLMSDGFEQSFSGAGAYQQAEAFIAAHRSRICASVEEAA